MGDTRMALLHNNEACRLEHTTRSCEFLGVSNLAEFKKRKGTNVGIDLGGKT